MTPTLFDVYEILGLAVDNDPVTCRHISDLRQYIEDNLGIVPDDNLTNLRHTWLKVNFRELPPDAPPVQVYRYTRAHLLFLISVTIFVDASVLTVPTRYLQFFEDIERAITYASVAAALAFLYRSLGKACTFKRRHFSGSATLMQVTAIWASKVMLAEALTLRHKWYPEVYNHINNTFETLSKFVPVDMGDV
ncbi:protein MAIN-LIKE 2-like [Amborella trichopoda]|uniref:protein MAIN-LIKE 2-like n=1 Tax=Amborella trichopoda TaxID=13333 RepID=UPI0005D2FF75|nr:protein MAIN-LIKE 2-like [Amborella trichopoda]|eukprot:XP_011626340.1 protein MAIN-LIKE 2-like [Amborella trichopoda]